MTAARAVCGFSCWGWSKKRLLEKVGWLSVRQLIFYHTTLQTTKTINSGKPMYLYKAITSDYLYRTEVHTSGQIRQDETLKRKRDNILID